MQMEILCVLVVCEISWRGLNLEQMKVCGCNQEWVVGIWEVPNMGISCLLTNSKKWVLENYLEFFSFLNWISHRKVPWFLAIKSKGFETSLFQEGARQKQGVCRFQDVCGPDFRLWVSFPRGWPVGDCPIPSPPARSQLVLGTFGGVHVTIPRLLNSAFRQLWW